MRGEYFFGLIAGITIGTLGGLLMSVPVSAILWLLVLATASGLIAARQPMGGVSLPLLVSVIGVGIVLALLRVDSLEPVRTAELDTWVGEEITLTGTVVREPEQRETTTHVYLKTASATVLVFADRFSPVAYGDVVQATGVLGLPSAFTTDLGRTFDYAGYLAVRDTGYTLRFAEVAITASNGANPFMGLLLTAKQRFLYAIEQAIPEPQSGLGAGLLLGVKQALGADLEQAFRHVGLTHIVVLSGYNVMLVVAFFMYVLAFILPYRWRLLVGMGGIAGFALMVGLSATVVRASVMAALLLLVRVVGGTHNIVRALCLAGAVMLLINPYLLFYDVGFQLSFIATAALIIGMDITERWLGWLPGTLGLREFAIATITTQLFVTPLLLFQIGEVSIVAVVANILVLPMVPVAMLLTFAAGLVGLVFPGVALLVGYVANGALTYIIVVAEVLAAVPFATVTVPAFHWSILVSAYALMAVGVYLWYQRSESTLQGDPEPADAMMDGWVIEEDIEMAGEQRSPATPPIFFR